MIPAPLLALASALGFKSQDLTQRRLQEHGMSAVGTFALHKCPIDYLAHNGEPLPYYWIDTMKCDKLMYALKLYRKEGDKLSYFTNFKTTKSKLL